MCQSFLICFSRKKNGGALAPPSRTFPTPLLLPLSCRASHLLLPSACHTLQNSTRPSSLRKPSRPPQSMRHSSNGSGAFPSGHLHCQRLPILNTPMTHVGNLGPEFQIQKFRNRAPCFECCILRDSNKPECIQRRESRMMRSLKITSHKQELRKLEIEPSKKHRGKI